MDAARVPPRRARAGVLRTLARLVLAAPLVGALAACAFWRPTTVPMAQIAYPSRCESAAASPRPLLVLLPGRFMDADEFAGNGLVDAVRRRGLDVDVVAVDAHLGYYRDRSFLERLDADVLAPARRRGVTQVWLVGISLGGFGSLLYADSHPEDRTIAGVVLLSPYLGEPRAGEQVRAAGGLRAWKAPADTDLDSDDADLQRVRGEQRAWRWLQREAEASPRAGRPSLYLAFGDEDRFIDDDRLLVAALPASRVVSRPGGHDWGAWAPLWETMLDRLPLPRRASCAVEAAASAPPRAS